MLRVILLYSLLLLLCYSSKLTAASVVDAVKSYNLKKHFVEAEDGHPVCVFEKGDPTSANCIILLHGRTWSSLPVYDLTFESTREDGLKERVNLSTMDALAANGVRVFAVDFRGFGGTKRDSTQWLSPQRCVLDLKSVIGWLKETCNVECPAILGWSQGGLIALLYAQKFPETISAAVFYASIYDPKHIYQRLPFVSKSTGPLMKQNTLEAALEDFTLPGSISSEAAYAFGNSALLHNPVKVDWNNLHEFNEVSPAYIHTPSLVMHGDIDPYLVKEAQLGLFSGTATFIVANTHCLVYPLIVILVSKV